MPIICKFENCRGFANYGTKYGEPLYCNKHKGDCKNSNIMCRHNEGCGKQPSFNFEGETVAIFCATHKKENMIDIRNRKCGVNGCRTSPRYNFPNETTAIACSIHKSEGMIDVVAELCSHANCYIRPSYNYDGEKKGKFCKEHKLENMVLVLKNFCNHDGCKTNANFNFPGETKGKYCAAHKEEGMIILNIQYCVEPECTKVSVYNNPGETVGIYCTAHKKEGMVDVKNKKCQHVDCIKAPAYNVRGTKNGIYCFTHKKEGMVNVKTPLCKSGLCETITNVKYKGYCARCYQQLFPTDPLTFQIRSKTKEIAVRDYINSQYEGFAHDVPLWISGCDCTHRRKIDHRKLIGNTLLCIETDEFQHRSYDKYDENIRYDDLYMLHGGKFIFIRFNPDKFQKNGKSCNPMLYTRLPVLKAEIDKHIKRIENDENTELVEITYLYYTE